MNEAYSELWERAWKLRILAAIERLYRHQPFSTDTPKRQSLALHEEIEELADTLMKRGKRVLEWTGEYNCEDDPMIVRHTDPVKQMEYEREEEDAEKD